MVKRLPVVSIQVFSVEYKVIPRTRLKERRILSQNVFLVYVQTILEVDEIFVQICCLSSYCLRADVSYFLCCTRATKEIGDVCTQARVRIETTGFREMENSILKVLRVFLFKSMKQVTFRMNLLTYILLK